MADTEKKNYFAFEGGGGKGAAYLAVAQALEAISAETGGNAYDKISGFSGSSAGAITAMMLSLETNSQALEYLMANGIFEKMFPTSDPFSKGYQPYWRGFIQTGTFSSGGKQKSIFSYAKINAPITTKEKFKELYSLISLEFVEDALLSIGVLATGLANLPLAALMDKNNLIRGFIHEKLNSPLESGLTDGNLLTTGSVANLLTTGGLFPGEEVLDFALYFSWFVKNRGMKLNDLDGSKIDALLDFENTVRGLKKRYFHAEKETKYTMDFHGYINDEQEVSKPIKSGVLPTYYYKAVQDGTKQTVATLNEEAFRGTMGRAQIGEEVLLTFQELYDLTKKELVLTSVNLLNGVTYYFSHLTTPDFPVAVAVAMSMNLPVWSPIYIRYTSPNGLKYDGWYFDGGVNHNLPMRVFNTDWSTYNKTYKLNDKANMGFTKHNFYGFKLDEDETMFLQHFPSAQTVAGALASLKLEQSTFNYYHDYDHVATLSTSGLSLLKFTPSREFFKSTNPTNKSEILSKLKKWKFY